MRVIMVKKVLTDQSPCRKCVEAEEMLKKRGGWDRIDEVIIAKEDEPDSPGMRLAQTHQVDRAPFFLVEREGEEPQVYVSVMRLIRDHLSAPASSPTQKTNTLQVEAVNEELSTRQPEAIVRWALERWGRHCAIAFSGAEDVALVHMAAQSGLEFSVFCLDTGRLHPQTLEFVERVRAHYQIPIQVMSPERQALEEFVQQKGLFSFYDDGHKECCGIRKVAPLRRALSAVDAWITGQRRDQSPDTRGALDVMELDTGFSGRGNQLYKFNPLAAWTSDQVWDYIKEHSVPYNPLHDQGFRSIGCAPCTRPVQPHQHEREGRWWWEDSSKKECGLHLTQAAAENESER